LQHLLLIMTAHEAVDLVQRKFVRKPPTKLSTFTYQVLTSSHSNLTKGCIAATHGRQSLYFTVVRLILLKISPSRGGIWTPCNTWFLGPTQVHIQMASRPVQLFLQGLWLWQTDWQTDHATTSVTIGCIYVVLRCSLKTCQKVHILRYMICSYCSNCHYVAFDFAVSIRTSWRNKIQGQPANPCCWNSIDVEVGLWMWVCCLTLLAV